MKKLNSLITLFVIIVLLTSCAKDIVINYASPTPNSGHICIKPSEKVKASCSLNDSLMVEGRKIKSITIKNVPSGINSIQFSGKTKNIIEGGVSFKSSVTVINGRTNTQLVTVQTKKTGFLFTMVGTGIISLVCISSLYLLEFF